MPSNRRRDASSVDAASRRTIPTSRRQFLAALGTAGSVGLAGCTVFDRPITGGFPGAGIDAENTGFDSTVTGPETPRVRWQTHVGEWLGATPVVADESVFLPYPVETETQDEYEARIGAWDASTGQRNWSTTTGTVSFDSAFEIARDSLVYDDGALYVADATGFHSFTPDGERRWHTPVQGRQTNPAVNPAHPAIQGDTGYFPTAGIVDPANEGVHALATADGSVRWRYRVPDVWTTADAGTRMVFAPAVANATCYVGVHGNGVAAVDIASGEERWRTGLPVNGPPSVLTNGDALVHLEWYPPNAEDARTGVARLDTNTGEVVWRTVDEIGARSGVQLATDHEHVYYSAGHDVLRARRVSDGRVAWDSRDVAWVSQGAPVVGDQRVWSGVVAQQTPDFDGVAVLAADRETGETTVYAPFREDFSITSGLAVTEDAIFLAADGATLWALDDCRHALGDDCVVY